MKFYTISLPNVTPLKLVTAKANYGIGFLTAFMSGLCSLFGTPNDMYTEKIRRAENLAMQELMSIASSIGADGIMDIRCQIDGLSFLISGTAYKCSAEEKSRHEETSTKTSEPATFKTSEASNEINKNYTDAATFSTTEKGTIVCSHCKTEQNAGRRVCWNCGVKFIQ